MSIRAGWPSRAWAVPGLIFLLVMLGSLGPTSYFLHFDTPTQHVEAADLLRACLGTGSGKPGVVLPLAAAFALGGVNPLWEGVLLALLGAIGLAAFYRLLARLTGSPRWAMLGALWFLSLPQLLYYTRIHLGFSLAFLALGLMLQSERRFGWAGAALAAAMLAHPSFVVPVAAWIGWSALLDEEPVRKRLRSFLRLAAGMLAPIAAVEALYYLFDREVLYWTLGVIFGEVSRAMGGAGDTNWTHLWHLVSSTNGWLNALLLLAGAAYPAVRKPRVPLMDAIYLTGWSIVAGYTVQVGLTRTPFFTRVFSGAYPLLVASSVFTLMRLATRLAPSARAVSRLAAVGIVTLALPLTIVQHTLDAAVASRTAYGEVNRVMAEAAEAGLPVRYFGNMWTALFFGQLHGTEVAINETSLDIITGDTRAVLIFEGADHPTLSALQADERLDTAAYSVSTYRHLAGYRPRLAETALPTGDLAALRRAPRARDAEAESIIVWWPRQPSGTFEFREVYDAGSQVFVLHYPGSGCVTAKRYGYGTKNYYDLIFEGVWERLTGAE